MNESMVFIPPFENRHRSWAQRLAAEIPDLEIVVAEDVGEATEALKTATAAFGTLTPALLSRAKNLRWLQAPYAAPPFGFYFDELSQHPVEVTNLRAVYTENVATHCTALILALARGFHLHFPRMLRSEWVQDRSPETTIYLQEATVLIVGMGNLGQMIGHHLAAFDARIVGIDAKITELPGVEMHGPSALDDLLPLADIVVLTVPHTPKTEGLMHRARFRMMKRTAAFVNIGRGGTVRLVDLVDALNTGEIAAAALDVFEEEPLPVGHPLWDAPNVLMTPHVGEAGPYVDERRYQLIADNARRFLSKNALLNPVDKAEWY